MLHSYASTLNISRAKCPGNMMWSLPQALEQNPAIVLRFLHRLVHYDTGTSRAQTARYTKTKTSIWNLSSTGYIALGQDGTEKKQKSHNVPAPAWLLVPEFLDQRAQYFSLNPSFVQGPTMTLLTFLSTSNSLVSESLPPSYSPWLDQPTLSPVTLTHNLVIHTYHHCTLYILYFIWKMLLLGFWCWVSCVPGWVWIHYTSKEGYPETSDPPASTSCLKYRCITTTHLCRADNRPQPLRKSFSFIPNTEKIFIDFSMHTYIGNDLGKIMS